jgi:four helix bundle protein
MPTQAPLFDHERLDVYHKSLDFAGWVWELLPTITKAAHAQDQLERAGDSIALNIAEGNGKFTEKDRCKFFDIARGSAFESSAALDLLRVKKRITMDQATTGKLILVDIVNMLVGLIKANSSSRIAENNLDDSLYTADSLTPKNDPSIHD